MKNNQDSNQNDDTYVFKNSMTSEHELDESGFNRRCIKER